MRAAGNPRRHIAKPLTSVQPDGAAPEPPFGLAAHFFERDKMAPAVSGNKSGATTPRSGDILLSSLQVERKSLVVIDQTRSRVIIGRMDLRSACHRLFAAVD
jgi:hypothetical protein